MHYDTIVKGQYSTIKNRKNESVFTSISYVNVSMMIAGLKETLDEFYVQFPDSRPFVTIKIVPRRDKSQQKNRIINESTMEVKSMEPKPKKVVREVRNPTDSELNKIKNGVIKKDRAIIPSAKTQSKIIVKEQVEDVFIIEEIKSDIVEIEGIVSLNPFDVLHDEQNLSDCKMDLSKLIHHHMERCVAKDHQLDQMVKNLNNENKDLRQQLSKMTGEIKYDDLTTKILKQYDMTPEMVIKKYEDLQTKLRELKRKIVEKVNRCDIETIKNELRLGFKNKRSFIEMIGELFCNLYDLKEEVMRDILNRKFDEDSDDIEIDGNDTDDNI